MHIVLYDFYEIDDVSQTLAASGRVEPCFILFFLEFVSRVFLILQPAVYSTRGQPDQNLKSQRKFCEDQAQQLSPTIEYHIETLASSAALASA